jgi:hypothetical protein
MQDQKSLTLHWRSFSEWGRECVTSSFAYKDRLYRIYECLHPIATQITRDARPKIIDSPLTLICRMGQGAFLTCFDYKGGQYIRKGQQYSNVNNVRLAIGYLNATINRNTWHPEPEIGTNSLNQTRHNPRVNRYGSGFGLPRCAGTGVWTGLEPNRTVLAVETRTACGLPGPIDNTSYRWCINHVKGVFANSKSVNIDMQLESLMNWI